MANNSMKFNVNFNSTFDSSQILKGLEEVRKKMGAMSADEQIFKGVDKEFTKLKSLLSTLDAQSKNVGNAAGLNAYQRTLERVRESANRISQEMGSIAKNETQAFNFKDVAEAQKKIQQLQTQLGNINSKLQENGDKIAQNFKGLGVLDDAPMEQYVQRIKEGQSAVRVLGNEFFRQLSILDEAKKKLTELKTIAKNTSVSAHNKLSNYGGFNQAGAEAYVEESIRKRISQGYARGFDASTVTEKIKKDLSSDAAQGLEVANLDKLMNQVTNAYNNLIAQQTQYKNVISETMPHAKSLQQAIGAIQSDGIASSHPELAQLIQDFRNGATEAQNLDAQIENATNEMNNLNSQDELDKIGDEAAAAAAKTETLVDAQEDSVAAQREANQQQQILNSAFDRMGNVVKNVLSIGNAWRQVNRWIRQTFQDVQKLDTAFASIAMVTNYQVGDLWEQYDQYSELANKLGQTTEGAIKSSALFYQQG